VGPGAIRGEKTLGVQGIGETEVGGIVGRSRTKVQEVPVHLRERKGGMDLYIEMLEPPFQMAAPYVGGKIGGPGIMSLKKKGGRLMLGLGWGKEGRQTAGGDAGCIR